MLQGSRNVRSGASFEAASRRLGTRSVGGAFGAPLTAIFSAGTIAHAAIGAPDCLRQSRQWRNALYVASFGASNATAPQWRRP